MTTFVQRDLLGEKVEVQNLWDLPEPRRLLGRQQANGAWRYPVKKPPPQNYDLYETFVTLGELVGKYGFDRRHPAFERAAQYVFSCQTPVGDLRGIYGNQPAHTYTPALMEVLIKAGYAEHPAIERAFRWLLATRQDDGSWAIPTRTLDMKLVRDWDKITSGPEIAADPSRPFSHLVTGMVLRAFTAHPRYRKTGEAIRRRGAAQVAPPQVGQIPRPKGSGILVQVHLSFSVYGPADIARLSGEARLLSQRS